MKTKLVRGQGVYERGTYLSWVDGTKSIEYKLWVDMLARCRPGGVHQQNQPAYVGCMVHPDFIKFQDFAAWLQNQIGFGIGWALDKDILFQGNKVYGPDTCCFVPVQINSLFTHGRSNKGQYPTGVSFNKQSGRYRAQIHVAGKNLCIGQYTSPELAYEAYKAAKLNEINRQAEIWKDRIDPRVYLAMKAYRFD